MSAAIEYDVTLCEDGRTIWAYCYAGDDLLAVKTVATLPLPIDEETFDELAQEWRAALTGGSG